MTTPNSHYARSELREMNRDGTAANWSLTGTHRLSATLRVVSVTSNVCVGADPPRHRRHVHQAAAGAVLPRQRGGHRPRHRELPPSGGQTLHTVGHVSLGKTWRYTIGVSGGNTIDVTVDGSTTHYPIASSFQQYKQYFKAGSYNQSSSDSTTKGARVAFYGLTVSHS